MTQDQVELKRCNSNEEECPEGCCTGNEILCLSIPCPVTIVLLGITLTLELPCLRLTSEQDVSASQVAPLLQALTGVLGALSSTFSE
jgi:hypothetical protein